MNFRRALLSAISVAITAFGCAPAPVLPVPAPVPESPAQVIESPPPVAREFRAVWIASVTNIDWPSRPGLSTAAQQAELLAILDRAAALHLNAIILQVRRHRATVLAVQAVCTRLDGDPC